MKGSDERENNVVAIKKKKKRECIDALKKEYERECTAKARVNIAIAYITLALIKPKFEVHI